jgi:hypothetical protein
MCGAHIDSSTNAYIMVKILKSTNAYKGGQREYIPSSYPIDRTYHACPYNITFTFTYAQALPETQPLLRARSCAESQIQSSRHRDALPRAKGPALGTEKTRGTDVLCREGTVPPLGTASDSRHRESMPRAAEAGSRHSRDLTTQRNGRHGRWPGRQMCREPSSGSRHRESVPSA